MPVKKEEHQEENALIVLTYFHPWTLLDNDTTEHTPHARDLKLNCKTWTDALKFWFDGKVLCEDVQKYIINFLNVTQLRPDFEQKILKHEDDIFSDEDIDRDELDLETLLSTQIASTKEKRTRRLVGFTR